WFGTTVDHIVVPSQSFMENSEKVPVKISVFGGGKIGLKRVGKEDEVNLTYAVLVRNQRKFSQLDAGMFWYQNPLVIGLWYRGIPLLKSYKPGYPNNDAVVLLAGYKIERFSIGYSYDFPISRLFGLTGGSHEISLIFEFNQNRKTKKKHKIVSCPKFWGY
ncbi:MAG: type IX secretion system membrane protein PorP/SprF, partial [Bacteroidetes bacterium]|nr:type IX secretion system membrane protein PorP/SprF [Bacteroidota bacterium]